MAASTSENFPPDRSGDREPAPAQPSGTAPAPVRGRTPRHEIRALLRAHLAAASGYRHLTRHCAVCARLLRLAMEPLTASGATEATSVALASPGTREAASTVLETSGAAEATSTALMASRAAEATSTALASSGPSEPPPTPLAGTGPRESALVTLSTPGPPGTAPAPTHLACPGPPGATPPAMAAPEPPPEQTGVHVMPSQAREQTVRPVTGSRSTPSLATAPASAHSASPDTGPHAFARRPASARMTTRLVPARTSASTGGGNAVPDGGDPGPDGGDQGPGGRRGPGWAEDESPPAA
ncbi:DUF6274 family protein [Streptomyces sp. NBC_00184]|uniref:DUF6274 family protein n=1 Tax=Streptomyces sp. NBC_00184 TaxID=2975673 RepID=UPI003FA7AC62